MLPQKIYPFLKLIWEKVRFCLLRIFFSINFRFTYRQVITTCIVLCVLLIFMMWEGSFARRLTMKVSPDWIISLKSADNETAHKIKDAWEKHNVIDHAKNSLLVDGGSIIFYTAFLICLLRGLKIEGKLRWIKKVLFIGCLSAMLADFGENTFIYFFLDGDWSPGMIPVFSTVNFSLLISIAAFLLLIAVSHWVYPVNYLYAFFRIIRLFLPGLLIVFLCYIVFTAVTIGEDMVLQVGEYSGPTWLTIICTALCAWYCWYSTRIVGKVRQTLTLDPAARIPDELYTHFARLIGVQIIAAVQVAILGLPVMLNFTELQVWSFLILHTVFYFISIKLYSKNEKLRDLTLPFVAGAIVYALAIFVLIKFVVLDKPDSIPPKRAYQLGASTMILFAIELVMIHLLIWRRRTLNAWKEGVAFATSSVRTPVIINGFSEKLKVLRAAFADEKTMFIIFNVAAVAGLIIYIINFNQIDFASVMGPLATILLMFGALVGVANILSTLTIITRINSFIVLLILAMLLGRFSDQYDVRINESSETMAYYRRPFVENHFKAWLEAHRKSIRKAPNTYEVYIVIADGGASRSGYWVSSVLSALQDSSIAVNKTDPFSDHVYCLTGTSGGGVGVAAFYSILKSEIDSNFSQRSDTFLQQDFLSPIISHYLGTDLLRHAVPLDIEDRAGALERALEHFDADEIGGQFKLNFSKVMDVSGKLPVLFINTTQVQQGSPAVVSTIRLDGMSKRIDVLDRVARAYPKGGELRFSTAAILGARFPYVSPAGGIGDDFFVDGGYFDNTGAGVVHEMMQKIDSLRDALIDHPLYDSAVRKLRFRILYLSNGSVVAKKYNGVHPFVNELAAPVLTVLGTYSSQTTVNNDRLFTFMKREDWTRETIELNLYTSADTVKQYPMNWVISDYNLDRMKARLKEVKAKDFEKIKLRN